MEGSSCSCRSVSPVGKRATYAFLFVEEVSHLNVMSLPSPAASPSLKPTELIPAGRKRQRSQSMQSDSSSIKRSASEGPSSATPIPIMTDPISSVDSAREHEIEIDAYMAEQGEDIPAQPGSLTIEQKVERIKYLRDKPMVAGDTWYIISRQWFRPWEIACGILSDKSLESLQEKDIGPPDNSSLFDSQGNLISNLVEHIDVEFLPEEAWSELVAWCVSLLDFFDSIFHIPSGMASR